MDDNARENVSDGYSVTESEGGVSIVIDEMGVG